VVFSWVGSGLDDDVSKLDPIRRVFVENELIRSCVRLKVVDLARCCPCGIDQELTVTVMLFMG